MSSERRCGTGVIGALVVGLGVSAGGAVAWSPQATTGPIPHLSAAARPAPAVFPDPGTTGHSLGPPDAPVVVTEFSDFGCPYCAIFARTVFPVLRREYIETGRVRWLHVPFVLGPFPNSEAAVNAAECAADLGGYWALHEILFRRQAEWRESDEPVELFGRYAGRAGLDPGAVRACLGGGTRDEVGHGGEMALVAGVRATPTFFVDGRRMEGAVTLDEFRRILDAALEDAGAGAPAGAPAAEAVGTQSAGEA